MLRSFKLTENVYSSKVLLVSILVSGLLLLSTSCLALAESGIATKDKVEVSNATLKTYKTNCATCHGEDRLGLMGPALLPQNLKRLKKNKAGDVIKKGRIASQMPAYEDKLTPEKIQALVDYIYTPLPFIPKWGMKEIVSTQKRLVDPKLLPNKPVHKADPLNMFVVVEIGDHHVSILDGDKFEPIHRFQSHFALHGGPKFSPEGRYVYFASRDGWITKFDMYSLQVVADVRAGINTRNLAVSGDGRYVMVANNLPHSLVLLSAKDLTPIKVIPVVNEKGESSRVSAVYTAPPRKSFIAGLKDFTEVWEIPYEDNPLPVSSGTTHDYTTNKGSVKEEGGFPIRRIKLDDYLDDFFFDQSYSLLIGAARNGKKGQVVQMDARKKIAEVDLDGLPHLGSGITWNYKGRLVLATPNLKKAEISIIDMTTWKTIKRIKTEGPGFFMRSHENSPYAWAGVFFGPNKDAVHIIDKSTLEIVKTLRPEKGKTAAHVEFDQSGKHALLSIWDKEGAVIVYDSNTLTEVKRIPMVQPSGKYNVYNKITRSAGTSH